MNPLLQAKPSLIYSEYKKTGKLKFPEPYKTNYKLFIEHMLPIFAKVRLMRNTKGDKISMSATLRSIPKSGIEGFSFEDIYALIQIAAKVPRSAMVRKMVEHPRFGSLTPLFMYAHKLYDDVAYSSWDPNDVHINVALGLFLAKAMDFQKAYPLILDIEDDTRKALVDDSFTAYPTYLTHSVSIDPTEDDGYEIKYPKEWLIMNCQYWIANAEVRDTKAMLLDLKNFGRVPKAKDVVGYIQVQEAHELDPETCSWD